MLKIEELREIIKVIDESSIHEFTYETEQSKVILKKQKQNQGNMETISETQKVNHISGTSTEEQIGTKQQKQADVFSHSQESTIDYDHEIVSPMVGTLYRAPSPESEPYITVGSQVTNSSIVCIVEAMKLFNEIEAEVDGEIVEVLVGNGELVEYGQPLFRVKTK